MKAETIRKLSGKPSVRKREGEPPRSKGGQTLNDAPQPQLFLTFGLFSLKPDSIRASE